MDSLNRIGSCQMHFRRVKPDGKFTRPLSFRRVYPPGEHLTATSKIPYESSPLGFARSEATFPLRNILFFAHSKLPLDRISRNRQHNSSTATQASSVVCTPSCSSGKARRSAVNRSYPVPPRCANDCSTSQSAPVAICAYGMLPTLRHDRLLKRPLALHSIQARARAQSAMRKQTRRNYCDGSLPNRRFCRGTATIR